MPHRVPKRNYFEFAFPCQYRRKGPKIDGELRDWRKKYLVPDLMALEGMKSYADVFFAWNEKGLYLALSVKGKANPITVNGRQPLSADAFAVWLDMRDARTMHRAGRYCHQFTFLPGSAGGTGNEPRGFPVPIARAPEKSVLCPPDMLEVAVRPARAGYSMEMAIPAEALHGFDPEQHPRLGFTYLVNDTHLGAQWWSVSRQFRFQQDPSMWGTAVLTR